MQRFITAHAKAEDAATAARLCAERLLEVRPIAAGMPASLGIVYCCDPFARQLPEIHEILQAATGVEHWVGATGLGIIVDGSVPPAGSQFFGDDAGAEYHDQPALCAMLCCLPPESLHLFGLRGGDADTLPRRLLEFTRTRHPGFGIVHGDPRGPRIQPLIESLSRDTGCFLVGGLSAAPSLWSEDGDPGSELPPGRFPPQAIAPDQIAGTPLGGGISGVLLGGSLEIATGLTQGCTPIGPTRTVTKAQTNVIMELDGQRALDALMQDTGPEFGRDLRRVAGRIHCGLPVPGGNEGDYLVRNLMAIDPQRGWIAIGESLQEGEKMLFCQRDRTTAVTDMQRMLQDLKRRAGKPPLGGLYHSCTARGPHSFAEAGAELAFIRETFGRFPLVGMFGNGEICQGRIYGYTGVLTLFL